MLMAWFLSFVRRCSIFSLLKYEIDLASNLMALVGILLSGQIFQANGPLTNSVPKAHCNVT